MMHVSLLLFCTLAAAQVDTRPAASAAHDSVTLSHCLISLAEEAQVPAKEAGQLVEIPVTAGSQVTKGQLLAQIDDARPQIELKGALYKWDVDKQKASNDINVRYADKGAKVSEHAYLQKLEANRKVSGTVSDIEVEQTKLEWEKFVLQIEQSKFEMVVAGLEAKVKEAEADAARDSMERRKIRAPLDGVVVELKKHVGEWVVAGDPVLRVFRMDRLWIEGFLKADEYSPGEIDQRPVTVRVTLAHGRTEDFHGQVIFVNPQIEPGGEFRIRAEVYNRAENGNWMLQPGHTAEMTIHLK